MKQVEKEADIVMRDLQNPVLTFWGFPKSHHVLPTQLFRIAKLSCALG